LRTKIFTWLILGAFLSALVYFFTTRKTVTENDIGEIAGRSPVITMDGMSLWSYKAERAEWKLSAQSAVFVSPDVLELKSNVKYERDQGQKSLIVMAESALFNFETQGLLGIKNETQLREVLLEDDVLIKDQNYSLRTKSARYTPQDKHLSSVDPVVVKSDSMKFEGDSGFVYAVDKSELEMSGEIRGEIIRE
jgi:hypothetical protein